MRGDDILGHVCTDWSTICGRVALVASVWFRQRNRVMKCHVTLRWTSLRVWHSVLATYPGTRGLARVKTQVANTSKVRADVKTTQYGPLNIGALTRGGDVMSKESRTCHKCGQTEHLSCDRWSKSERHTTTIGDKINRDMGKKGKRPHHPLHL